MTKRCPWPGDDPLMVAYHDEEWGVPEHDDRVLFELLTLEGAQAGLSWTTILRKREGYREAFAGFDPARVARFGARDTKRLMADARIVRNRAKIESTITNAGAVLSIQRDHGSLDAYLWHFVGGTPVKNRWRATGDLPAQTDLSKSLSRELKRQGFRFVGPTTIYAFLQAAGFVNDHLRSCFRWQQPTAPSDG
jgi:DNA-3-methyladenine glycosylase I